MFLPLTQAPTAATLALREEFAADTFWISSIVIPLVTGMEVLLEKVVREISLRRSYLWLALLLISYLCGKQYLSFIPVFFAAACVAIIFILHYCFPEYLKGASLGKDSRFGTSHS